MSIDLDTEMQFLFGKLKHELGIDDDQAALKIILENFKKPINLGTFENSKIRKNV
ncbi:MAG: hypothetical protein O3B47_05050 [bacterium]|nr:hypothetical protein [bacterium]